MISTIKSTKQGEIIESRHRIEDASLDRSSCTASLTKVHLADTEWQAGERTFPVRGNSKYKGAEVCTH